MKIFLFDQVANPAIPLKCANHYTGSSLPIELVGVPGFFGGARVEGMKVRVTNPNGVEAEAPCDRCGSHWVVLFAATNFANYGFVSKGLRVTLVLKEDDGSLHDSILAVGDLDVTAANANAHPAEPSAPFYVYKGGDLYVKSEVRDAVQHYVKQTMEYVEGMGWGANWTGDYLLSTDGEFIPAN